MEVEKLLRTIYHDYAKSVGLNEDAAYIFGTPLRPVVPLDRGSDFVFILGAYPSARFIQYRKVSDVPAADNLGPFENERWFDGSRVREQPSARELNDHFLNPLKLTREHCWITDLVKVFLFKDGHIDKYKKLCVKYPLGYERNRFNELGALSLPWIKMELTQARPKLVITLGAEVAGILRGVQVGAKQTALLQPEVQEFKIAGMAVPVIHCAHPGILMRPDDRNHWPERHKSEFIPVIRSYLKKVADRT
jgi:uracil-DNA glycosylase